MKEVTKEQVNDWANRISELTCGRDPEVEHARADALLVEVLSHIGFDELVDEYHEVCKWYA